MIKTVSSDFSNRNLFNTYYRKGYSEMSVKSLVRLTFVYFLNLKRKLSQNIIFSCEMACYLRLSQYILMYSHHVVWLRYLTLWKLVKVNILYLWSAKQPYWCYQTPKEEGTVSLKICPKIHKLLYLIKIHRLKTFIVFQKQNYDLDILEYF